MPEHPDFLRHLAVESDRFAEVIAAAPPERTVPSCPEWTATDLWFHLAQTQWFWARIADGRLTEEAQVEALESPAPVTRPDELTAFFGSATAKLRSVLAELPVTEPVWTWADDHTAGFIRRRQAHEALIHRVDAELTLGERTPLDPELAADGVDEVLTLMYCPPRDWGEYRARPDRVVEFHTRDTGRRWLVTIGRFVGEQGGESYDRLLLDRADPSWAPSARVAGTAEDLDCWLWNRDSRQQPDLSGDPDTLSALAELMRVGID